MIERFFDNPLNGELGQGIVDSAFASSDVSMTLSASLVPFMCYPDSAVAIKALDQLLFQAYVAGNMQAQLKSGSNADRPEDGIRGVLRAYRAVRAKVTYYFVPEVDRWAARDSTTLRGLADSLARSPQPDCPSGLEPRYQGKVRLERRPG
jgi:hypothetical protein